MMDIPILMLHIMIQAQELMLLRLYLQSLVHMIIVPADIRIANRIHHMEMELMLQLLAQ